MPKTPPKRWFEDKKEQVKKGLKDAHADWNDKTLEEQASKAVGRVWYNNLSDTEKEKITREYESELTAKKEYDDYLNLCSKLEDENEKEKQEQDAMMKIVSAGIHDTNIQPPKQEEKPIHDGMDRLDRDELLAKKKDGTPGFISIPSYKFNYVAAPKFEGKDAPLIIKAIVLEEGENINKWKVDKNEFESVAAQYKSGRQLRLNHGKNVQDVFGRSFEGKTIHGRDIQTYMGKKLDGVRDDGLYVVAEFEANPQDAQVRTNILQGYVQTGSIGLDASAFCDECNKPVQMGEDKIDRMCKHTDAPLLLKNVDVKEYSYVAEPAYEHSIALPSFSAAVNEVFKNSSSIINTPTSKVEMSLPDTKIEASATAKKAESESDATAMAKMYADSEYKRGVAEGRLKAYEEEKEKVKAESEAEGKKKAEAKASVQTDQVGKVSTPNETKKEDLLAKIMNPVKNMDPWVREVFKAASEHPSAPMELRQKLKGRFD